MTAGEGSRNHRTGGTMRGRLNVTVTGVAVIALVAAAAAGCGSSSSKGGSSSPKTMELIVGTKSDDFYFTMECGAEAEAKKLGVKLTVTGPATFSVPQQKPLIDAVEVSKPGALLVAPTDSAALDPDLLKVQKNGTKIIFVDTSAANSAIGLSRISSDNALGGKLA